MSKEIIEELNFLLKRSKNYYSPTNHYNQGINYGIERCIEEIQKIENKPFDPEELGFKLTAESKIFSSDFVGIFEYYGANYKIRYLKEEDEIWIVIVDLNTEKLVCDLIKIPNHRFGKELLKNLGIIGICIKCNQVVSERKGFNVFTEGVVCRPCVENDIKNLGVIE